jgi:glycosyltransferase involved in cell wall biosynthesis
MRVVIILENLGGGGAERAMVNLANQLINNNIAVTIALGEDIGGYKDVLTNDITVVNYAAKGFIDRFFALRTFLKNNAFEFVITCSDYISATCKLIIQWYKISIKQLAILQYDLKYHLKVLPLPNRIFMRFVNKSIVARAHYVAGVSNGVCQSFKEVVGKKNLQVTTLFNPTLNNNIFEEAKKEVDEFTFDNDYKYLINVGRLEYQKNQALLIDAVGILKSKGYKIKLLILGTGILYEALQKQIKLLGLQEDVFLLGFQKNPFKFLARCDLFVLSSRFEGLALVLAESLALGVNIVATDCPSGSKEALEDGLLGEVCETENINALVTAIETGLKNPRPKHILEAAAQKYSVENTTAAYLRLMRG